jgi:hypothetical protein
MSTTQAQDSKAEGKEAKHIHKCEECHKTFECPEPAADKRFCKCEDLVIEDEKGFSLRYFCSLDCSKKYMN